MDDEKNNMSADEWESHDRDLLEFVLAHDPPRPYSYFRLMRKDFSSTGIYRFFGWLWMVALVLAIFKYWFAMSFILVVYLFLHALLMRTAIEVFRRYELVHGLIDQFRPHILNKSGGIFKDWSSAEAKLDDGVHIPVALCDVHSKQYLQEGNALEVLVLKSDEEFGEDEKNAGFMVIGYRPIKSDKPAGPNRDCVG